MKTLAAILSTILAFAERMVTNEWALVDALESRDDDFEPRDINLYHDETFTVVTNENHVHIPRRNDR